MSHYKTSNSFQRGIEQTFPPSIGPIPMIPAHSFQTNFIPSLDHVALAREGLSADYNVCPTKRIRYTQQNFAERNVNMDEIPVLMQSHDNRLSKAQQDFAKNIKDNRIHTSHRQWGDMEEIKYMKMYQNQREPSIDRIHKYNPFDDGLTIPPLVVESKNGPIPELQQMLNSKKPTQQMIDNFRYLSMLDQLAQQRAEYALQQERLEFFLHQQHQFSQQRKVKLTEDLYRLHQTPSSGGSDMQESVSHRNLHYFGLNEQQLQHQTQPQIQAKPNKKLIKQGVPKRVLVSETRSDEGKTGIKVEADGSNDDPDAFVRFEDLNDQFTEKLEIKGEKAIEKKEKKKANLPQSSTQKEKKRANQRYSFDFLGKAQKNPLLTADGAPRKKNTWQLKAQDVPREILSNLEEVQKNSPHSDLPLSDQNINTVPENEQIRQKGAKVKPQKPVDIPQHMQDDSMLDFNSLLSITLTNIQSNIQSDNGQSSGFVVVNKNFKTAEMGEIGEETRIGDQYQVKIPEMTKKRLKNKKKTPEVMWKPDIFKEGELKGYLGDLCEILKCESINEERALKLLKRKKFKKEKVKINITKNEKFYSTFLVVGNQTDEAMETMEPMEQAEAVEAVETVGDKIF